MPLIRWLALWLGSSLALCAAVAATVEKWGVFEIELKGPAEGNPFVEVRVGAVFTDGTTTLEAPGFYDGGGVYRVRFMPVSEGRWSYRTTGNRPELAGRTGEFTAVAPGPGNRGPVRVAREDHFSYADGTPYRPFGTTLYGWAHRPESWRERTLRSLAGSPFNKVRMLLTPQDFGAGQPPPFFPFVGTPPDQWDYTRFEPAFFRHVEARIRELETLGIECDLILFHPYGRAWKIDPMDPAGDDRYVRYAVARFAAFRNVWWSLANEYDYVRWKGGEDWDRMLRLVRDTDPYGHLRSIHNGTVVYNHTHPWVTHASIQSGAAVEEPGRAEIMRSVFRKPVVYDEVKYEGNIDRRWGRLDGRELTHRFWCGAVVGTYVSHGECLRETGGDPEDTWISMGGDLRGESPARIAFLRKILEDGPAEGIEPIDKWQEPAGMGGQPGLYYLLYFGRERPTGWRFDLFRRGLRDGLRFRVEIIDTWEMTITPVEGVFVTKKKDAYRYEDEQGRTVTLPGRPGMALRIRRVDDAATEKIELPYE